MTVFIINKTGNFFFFFVVVIFILFTSEIVYYIGLLANTDKKKVKDLQPRHKIRQTTYTVLWTFME